jgi:hypothetical protein
MKGLFVLQHKLRYLVEQFKISPSDRLGNNVDRAAESIAEGGGKIYDIGRYVSPPQHV